MAEVLGFDVPLPNIGITGGSLTLLVSIFAIVLFLAIAIWFFYQWRIYNKKIILFENIAGQGYQPTIKDKARLLKIGEGGEELLFLRRLKVYRTAYGRKMGKNTYWFAVGQDGYWYNIVLGDIDAKLGQLDIEPIDRDMRYMHVAIRRNIQERYRKLKFMDKYGQMVFMGIFLLIMIVGIWFLLDKMTEISANVSSAVTTSQKVMDATSTVLASLDNVCSASGVRGAG